MKVTIESQSTAQTLSRLEQQKLDLGLVAEPSLRKDLAFIPVDPRQEQWFYLGVAGFMEQADTKWIFPMHFWEDYTIIPKLIEHPFSEGWRDRIVEIHKEGEEFIR